MSAIIFTAGYTGSKPAYLAGAAANRDLTVIDTRINPVSRNPAWNRGALEVLLGNRYVHIRELGNRLYKGSGIQILDLDAGIKQVTPYLRSEKSVLLLCACAHHVTCHRAVVASALANATGCAVVHWNTDDLKNAAAAASRADAEGVGEQLDMFELFNL